MKQEENKYVSSSIKREPVSRLEAPKPNLYTNIKGLRVSEDLVEVMGLGGSGVG